MKTVSLVEDDDDYRELLRRVLRSAKGLRLISAYATAEEALRRLPLDKPAVVLMDIKLPGIDGIECVRRLRLIVPAPAPRFIMLTGHEDDDLIFESLKAGVHGFLLKGHLTGEKLLAAINEAVSGATPMSAAVARKVMASFEGQPRSAVSLSIREQEVLRCLAADMMYKEIADELGIAANTVRTHLESIYRKLHVHSRKDAAFYLAHPQEWIPPRDYLRN